MCFTLSSCNNDRQQEATLIFELTEDGCNYRVIGYEGIPKHVVIPSVYNGKPVIEIGNEYEDTYKSSAFMNCNSLESIYIPKSIRRISKYTFLGCSKIAFYLEAIKQNPHWEACGIFDKGSIVLNVQNYGVDDNGIMWATTNDNPQQIIITGYSGSSINTLVIPSKINDIPVSQISENAFRNCSTIKNIEIPNGVSTLNSCLFLNCTNLETVTIPASVSYISKSAFLECANLKTIFVDNDNPYYKSIDGNLYSKDGATLYLYTVGKSDESFSIPIHVTTIDEYAFYKSNLEKIIIPSSVSAVKSNAFLQCKNLTIYCELPEKPDCWPYTWVDNANVVWGYSE